MTKKKSLGKKVGKKTKKKDIKKVKINYGMFFANEKGKLIDFRMKTLQKFFGCAFNTEINLKIIVFSDKILEHVELYQKARSKLFKKYGEETKKGESKIKKEHLKTFYKEQENLLNVTADIVIDIIELSAEDIDDSGNKFKSNELRYLKDNIFTII